MMDPKSYLVDLDPWVEKVWLSQMAPGEPGAGPICEGGGPSEKGPGSGNYDHHHDMPPTGDVEDEGSGKYSYKAQSTPPEVKGGFKGPDDKRAHGEISTWQHKAELVAGGMSETEAQKCIDATGLYTGSSYSSINGALRKGESHELAPHIDKFLAASPKYPNAVYRATKYDLTNVKVGAVLEEKGFMSTSSSKNFTKSWSGSTAVKNGVTYSSVILAIENPETGVSVRHVSLHANENEVLFPSGTKLQVTKIGSFAGTTYLSCKEVQKGTEVTKGTTDTSSTGSDETADKFGIPKSVQNFKSGDYKSVNAHLRAGGEPTKAVQEMDEFVAKAPKVEGKVYRAQKIDFANLQVGSVISDKGFMSASGSKKWAEGWAKGQSPSVDGKYKPALLRIDKHVSGADAGDNEVLFPRGAKFKVTGITTHKSGKPFIMLSEMK